MLGSVPLPDGLTAWAIGLCRRALRKHDSNRGLTAPTPWQWQASLPAQRRARRALRSGVTGLGWQRACFAHLGCWTVVRALSDGPIATDTWTMDIIAANICTGPMATSTWTLQASLAMDKMTRVSLRAGSLLGNACDSMRGEEGTSI